MKLVKVLFVLFFVVNYVFAATGTIKGVITDKETGLSLMGVNVILDSLSAGAATDVDGIFEIKNVPPGRHTLRANMIGYTEYVISDIIVKEKKTTECNFEMVPSTIEGEAIVVSAQRPVVQMDATSSRSVSSKPGIFRRKKAAKSLACVVAYDAGGGIVHNTEEYDFIKENKFQDSFNNPVSTFSIDVDAASYSNMRRMIEMGHLPPADAIRVEELINYFNYEYPDPEGEHPFSITTEMAECPWNKQNKLVHIGIQGKKLDYEDMEPSNLVFLIDVSGSMQDQNKLPLVKSSLKLLLNELGEEDKVALVVYASASGVILESTPAVDKQKIIKALDKLQAGGSTAGGAGIKLAYKIAEENLVENGNNRVILATDGDFNVGVSSTSELVRMIEKKRQKGIYLTICGFGMGNYKDGRMEQISNAGNGNYYYIDDMREAKKIFVKEMRATLFTIAKDVKIQVEFNPAKIAGYRLIGYENRMLEKEDFEDDKIDAGELGAGHTVTALYEVVPVGVESEFLRPSDDLKYQKTEVTDEAKKSDEAMTIKFRYKKPNEDTSNLIVHTLKDKPVKLSKSSDNFRFSAAVAEFGMLMRDSEFRKDASWEQVLDLAKGAKGADGDGYRAEFIGLVEIAKLRKKSLAD